MGAPRRGLQEERRAALKKLAALIGLGFVAGVLIAIALSRGFDAADAADGEMRTAKRDLMKCGNLFERHNRIYEKEGAQAWQSRIKPDFLSAITWRTAWDTGSLFLEPDDVVQWVKAHPEEAALLLERAARESRD